jgi:hypothetical protein
VAEIQISPDDVARGGRAGPDSRGVLGARATMRGRIVEIA